MNKYHQKFPVYRDATRLLVETEQAVSTFPRYHKYTLDSEMRRTAYHYLLAVTTGMNDVEMRHHAAKKAHHQSKALRIQVQLAKSMTSMSFTIFERLAVLAVDVSKQCKYWQKSLQRPHPNELRYD